MSNDAEILSVPRIAGRVRLGPGVADRIDATARSFAPGAGLAVTPTGIGFCMAMNPRFLARVPAFDTVFGPGYGEEVDWCRKVHALGGRHLALPSLFVEHRGGASFGSEEKRRLVAANGALISARYPTYDAEVQAFIRTDPLATPRLALAIAWAAAERGDPLPVYLAHSMGGGAEIWLRHRIAAEIAGKGPAGAAVVLRVGGARRWQVEVHGPTGIVSGLTDESDLVARLLAPVEDMALVYSCGVGDPDPAGLPELLLRFADGARRCRIEVLIHDYLPLSPSFNLLDGEGRHAGLPDPADADPVHQVRRPDGSRVDLAGWRAAWGALLARADEVVTFSRSSRDLVAAACPGLGDRLRVRPHRLPVPVAAVPAPPADAPPVIGVLGNIGRPKGIGLLVRLSRRLARENGPKLVVIGRIDPAYALAPGAVVHGGYRPDELPALVARYGITTWFMPSIWPETFSFSTHEMLATGLPVIALDLGAQAEAVRAAPDGRVIAPGPEEEVIETLLALVRGEARAPRPEPGGPEARNAGISSPAA